MKIRPGLVAGRAALALALVLAACGGVTEPGDPVEASLGTEGLVITNGTSRAIFHAAANPRSLALIAIGTDPEETPQLAPGMTVTVPYADIVGWEGDPGADRVVLYHWRLVATAGGGWMARDVRSMEVVLQEP